MSKKEEYKIYRIYCKLNDLQYFGQTKASLRKRFNNHKRSCFVLNQERPLYNAFRAFGVENFEIELIELCNSSEIAAQREYFYIRESFTNFPERCLNKAISRTNTKNVQLSKLSGNNPNAKHIFAWNVKTDEKKEFDSGEDAANFFNQPDHSPISRRCLGRIKLLLNGEWAFSYDKDNFKNFSDVVQNQNTTRISVTNLSTGVEEIFNSYSQLEKTKGFPKGTVNKWMNSRKKLVKDPYKGNFIFKKV